LLLLRGRLRDATRWFEPRSEMRESPAMSTHGTPWDGLAAQSEGS